MTQVEVPTISQTDRIVKPIFISGLRKSGTSMSFNLLDGVPGTYTYPRNEVHFFSYTDSSHITSNRRRISGPMEDRVEAICADKWFRPQPKSSGKKSYYSAISFKEQLYKRLDGGLIQTDGDLLESILCAGVHATADYAGQPIDQMSVVVKGVQQAEFFPELLSYFPDIKFIYVLRNPFGQLNSAIHNLRHAQMGKQEQSRIDNDSKKLHKKLKYPYLGQRILEMRLSYYFMRKWAGLHPDNFRILVYDRLLDNPEAELRPLADWLGVEFDPIMTQVTGQNGSSQRTRSGWSLQGERKAGEISKAPMTAWKEQLPGGVQKLVRQLFRDVLQEFDFDSNGASASRWRRFDRSEDLRTYVANRFLFSKGIRRMVGPDNNTEKPRVDRSELMAGAVIEKR